MVDVVRFAASPAGFEREYQVDVARDQFGNKSGKPLVLPAAPASIVDDRLAFGIAEVLELSTQRCRHAPVCRLHPACEESHAPNLVLLGVNLMGQE
jgi:hypothetical protein